MVGEREVAVVLEVENEKLESNENLNMCTDELHKGDFDGLRGSEKKDPIEKEITNTRREKGAGEVLDQDISLFTCSAETR